MTRQEARRIKRQRRQFAKEVFQGVVVLLVIFAIAVDWSAFW